MDYDILICHNFQHFFRFHQAVVGQAASMLERHDSIMRLKCFRYAVVSRSAGGSNLDAVAISSGGGDAKGVSAATAPTSAVDSIFGRPAVLARLAHFLMDVQVTQLL